MSDYPTVTQRARLLAEASTNVCARAKHLLGVVQAELARPSSPSPRDQDGVGGVGVAAASGAAAPAASPADAVAAGHVRSLSTWSTSQESPQRQGPGSLQEQVAGASGRRLPPRLIALVTELVRDTAMQSTFAWDPRRVLEPGYTRHYAQRTRRR